MIDRGDLVIPFVVDGLDGPIAVPNRSGLNTLLMFFSESGTPLCSTEVVSVNDEAPLIAELGAVAVCISTDPPDVIAAFRTSASLGGIQLASDPEGQLAQRFGVYDGGTRRARRSAFVIDAEGLVILANHWYNPMNSEQLAGAFVALGLQSG